MALLDQFGSPLSERFARSVNTNARRGPIFRKSDAGIGKLIPSYDRKALAALSRKVVFNAGPARECIRQKAHYSTGVFKPTYRGRDADAGKAGADWLENEWFPVMDLSGGIKDWTEWVQTISKAIDRDGESFMLLTADPENGEPRVLMVPAYQVRSELDDETTVSGGVFDGAALVDGIGTDPSGRVVFYRVYSSETLYEDIPAASMIHVYERDFCEQRRGYPAFSASLDDILSSMESKSLEILRQLVVSNIFLLNKGGKPPSPQNAGFEANINTTTNEAILSEKIAPGIHYLNSEQELESITHTTPGTVWADFQTRIWKEAILGAGWSPSMVSIGGANTQGTVERADVLRARRAVDSRHALLCRVGCRLASYGLAAARNAPSIECFDWGFSKPPRLTVDDGREDRALLEQVKAGTMSERDFQATKGRTMREHLISRAQDLLDAEEVAAAMSTEGRPITAEELLVREQAPGGPEMEQPLEA